MSVKKYKKCYNKIVNIKMAIKPISDKGLRRVPKFKKMPIS